MSEDQSHEIAAVPAGRQGFNHQAIDAKWQQRWADSKAFEIDTAIIAGTNHFYCLDMFPYPSGAGLHVGHPRGYVATDVVARMKRAQGYTVLHPMGWDAFGLPAENYAIKTGIHPRETTAASINRFRKQMQIIGLSYDWSREVTTSDPSYYQWTQWLFLKLYEHDLAYQKEAPVNWCPKDQTVLANEQVVSGVCERCGTAVEQRNLTQWFFKTTAFADELLADLDTLDWPESIKAMQKNWIGKSEGATIQWQVADSSEGIRTFTTRPDTLFGVSYLVLAPEHPLVDALLPQVKNAAAIEAYRTETTQKTELERKTDTKTKSGVPMEGISVLHPLTNEPIPVWIADYVLMGYGTGAIMAVPAHDERDWAFAQVHDLPIRWVVESPTKDVAYPASGALINSGEWTGLQAERDSAAIFTSLQERGIGERTTTYRLRDWLVSRQRYWGTPIPIIHCPTCGIVPVPVADLPVRLPEDVSFEPTGESPLARSETFKNVDCPNCHGPATREVDTMDTFVDSSWYFLRYLSPNDDRQAVNVDLVRTWLPADLLVGGAEHAILHLLYARFMVKAIALWSEIGVNEPFQRLVNVGLIQATDGQKMSKSLDNVINPDDIVHEYGADTLRGYELFMGPFSDSMPWSDRSVVGVRRWLDRIWELKAQVREDAVDSITTLAQLEETVEKVTNDIDTFKFNTAVSSLMELTNTFRNQPGVSRPSFGRFIQLLAPIAPHLASELWEVLVFQPEDLITATWPVKDPSVFADRVITIAVQVNGRTRGTIQVTEHTVETDVVALARSVPAVLKHLQTEPTRTIVVPGKIVNFLA